MHALFNWTFLRGLAIVSTLGSINTALILFAIWAVPAFAQDFGPERPLQHQDAYLSDLLAADQAAYEAAVDEYDALIVERMALTAANAALEEALASGEAQTSPNEELAVLAQEVINARVGRDMAQATYDTAMAELATARAAYEAVVRDEIDELMAIEDSISEANDFAAEQSARIDALEAQAAALLAATCAGHAYDHAHEGAYVQVCPRDVPSLADVVND